MTKRYLLLISAIAFLLPYGFAQNRKKVTKKPVKEEVIQEDPRITQMLSATRRILFIDSMVVDFHDFIKHIPLSEECGQLLQQDSLATYINELKDHKLTTAFNATDSLYHIMESHCIAQEWEPQTPIKGLGEASANFPYMMPDGITLYFAQKGEKSIGGYDLFVTRYDSGSGTFLRSENIGMPFSSEANDYLYAIDETNNLGYLVTDRRQPAGKVCIYVFVPNETRRIYQTEAYTDEQLRSFASIGNIKDTWTSNEMELNDAILRLNDARAKFNATGSSDAISSVKTPLDDLRHQADVLTKALQLARNYYARANENERRDLRTEILNSEQELETLQLEIRQKEKEERNKTYSNNN